MRSLLPSRIETARTARISAVLYPALAAPAALLLIVTAFVNGDSALFLVAAVLFIGAFAAGALTAFLVRAMDLGNRSRVTAFAYWTIALVAPVFLVWEVVSALASYWLRSSALRDALAVADEPSFELLLAGVIASTLLAVGMTGNAQQPVALRHRRGVFTDRTIFAVAALALLALAVIKLTQAERFASDDPNELRAQMPRLLREAARYPNHFRSQYLFGNGLNKSHDCAGALVPLQRAVALDSSDGWALNDLGFALSCGNRYAEAVPLYLASVRLLPEERRPRYGLAWALEQTRASSAEREYRAILGQWPGDPFAMAREATLRYNRGERTEGLTEMRQALAVDSSYWVRLAAAQLFSSAALLSDALVQYRALATRDSANLWMWAHYGSAAYLAGELAEARRAFDHADSIDPTALNAVAAWRDMRDASRRGVPPSALPPIAPYRRPKH